MCITHTYRIDILCNYYKYDLYITNVYIVTYIITIENII